MNRHLLSASLLSMVLLTACACSTAVNAPERRAVRDDVEHYRKMERAAEDTLRRWIDERNIGQQPLTPEFIERQRTWSQRLTTARCRLATPRDQSVAAVTAYLEGMKQLHQTVQSMQFQDGWKPVSMTAFYVAEAELWLDRVRHASGE